MPERSIYSTSADRHKFSQGKIEAINTEEHSPERFNLRAVEQDIPDYLANILLEHDTEAEYRLREMGNKMSVRFISCKGIVENKKLTEQMRRMLRCIQNEYDYPVDTEFTVNISDNGDYSVNLLQCRPLQVLKDQANISVPEKIPSEHILLESYGASMGLSRNVQLDIIVYVDPVGYYNLPYNEKIDTSWVIGKINRHFREQEKHMMLMVPGRIGTTSPELGLPTSFADISAFEVICEIEEETVGYNPELSYGSHIFQDLTEADILYTAVFKNKHTLHYSPDCLKRYRNIIGDFDSSSDIIGIYDVSGSGCSLYHDIKSEHLMITI